MMIIKMDTDPRSDAMQDPFGAIQQAFSGGGPRHRSSAIRRFVSGSHGAPAS